MSSNGKSHACEHCGGRLISSEDTVTGAVELKCLNCGRSHGDLLDQATSEWNELELQRLVIAARSRLREAETTVGRLRPVVKHLEAALAAGSGGIEKTAVCESCGHTWTFTRRSRPQKCVKCATRSVRLAKA